MNNIGEDPPEKEELARLLGGFWCTAVAHALARLRIPDAMGDGQSSSGALAAELGLHRESLYRLLRGAAALDLVRQRGVDAFSLTATGRYLRSDVPGSMHGMAMHTGGDVYRAFGELADSVRTGRPPAWVRYGPDGFAELNEDPQAAAVFNEAMAAGSVRVAAEAARAYDFSRFDRIMDVGGGYGAVLAALLQANPQQTGSILDLPHGAEGALAYLREAGVADRARYITGSFFEEVPAEADCYVLKYIIHDWDDDAARRILANCARAARRSGGVVVLLERIVPDSVEAGPDSGNVLRGDLTMMLWGGKERTREEFATLLDEAGLTLTQIVPLPDAFAVIEAAPAGSA